MVRNRWLYSIGIIILVILHVRPLFEYHRSETDDWRSMGHYLSNVIKREDVIVLPRDRGYSPDFLKVCPYFKLHDDVQICGSVAELLEIKDCRNIWYVWFVKDWLAEEPQYPEFKKKWFVFWEITFNGYIKLLQLRNLDSFKVENFDVEIFESEFSPGQIGKIVKDKDASCGMARWTRGKGVLLFGHYIRLPKGDYTVRFRLKINNSKRNEEAVMLDVYNYEKNIQYGVLPIKASDFINPHIYQDFEIIFNNEDEGKLEFRVFSCGNTSVWIDCVELEPALKDAVER